MQLPNGNVGSSIVKNNNGGVVFFGIVNGLTSDLTEMKAVLRILIHVLTVSEACVKQILQSRRTPPYQSLLQQHAQVSPMISFVSNARIGISGVPLMDRLFPDPKLLILEESGKTIKMTVPSLRVIAAHSAKIAAMLEVSWFGE